MIPVSSAPIVPDEILDRLGRRFLAHGGAEKLGRFEDFVRRAHQQSLDVRAYQRAQQRRAFDQIGKDCR